MKSLRLVVIALILLVIIVTVALRRSASLTCQVSYRNDTSVQINSHRLSAEIAKTPAQLTKGLGGRACMGPNQAMLFVFNQPGYYPFWMKDMHFAIDMIWLGPNHKVVHEQTNVSPSTYPQTFTNTAPAQYVLEIQASRANQLGVATGTLVKF